MRINVTAREYWRVAVCLCVLLSVLGTQVNASRIGRQGPELTWNEGPYQLWGIDISAAALSDESTEQAIGAFNTYAKYGVSTVALSFQPSDCGYGVFAEDGSVGNKALCERIMRLVQPSEHHPCSS